MFKLIAKKEMFKLSSLLISVLIFGTSCESIKKKSVQSEPAPASRSLASLPKSSVSISRTQFDQLKRGEGEILSKIKEGPLKVAYSLLVNKKTGRTCYVESFKTKDIVPSFAQPASYEEVRPFKKPPFPKCSGQEYSMISSYQSASVLTDDLTGGVQVAYIKPLIILCAIVSVTVLSKHINEQAVMSKIEPYLALTLSGFSSSVLTGAVFATKVGLKATVAAASAPICVIGVSYGVYHVTTQYLEGAYRIKPSGLKYGW